MSEVYREGSLTEQMSKKARDAQDAAKYRDLMRKEEARGTYAAGMERGLAEMQAAVEAQNSLARAAQQMGGMQDPRYKSPQWGEPTIAEMVRAQDSMVIPAMVEQEVDARSPYKYAPQQWAPVGV